MYLYIYICACATSIDTKLPLITGSATKALWNLQNKSCMGASVSQFIRSWQVQRSGLWTHWIAASEAPLQKPSQDYKNVVLQAPLESERQFQDHFYSKNLKDHYIVWILDGTTPIHSFLEYAKDKTEQDYNRLQ